jgi:predicted P-loop ATPase
VLEGEQNKGKSTALRTLAAPWFSDTIFQVNSKDAYQQIQGMWLYEISELESFGRVEATAVKAFISSVEDNYRAPYERANERHKRQTVFAGTTNAKEWLKDWTGNTRFWPIEVEAVGPIDVAGLAKARDQLFAEAVAMFKKGERRYPTHEIEDEYFRPHQDMRMIVHPWVDKIAEWLLVGAKEEITINELLIDCLRVDMSRINPTGSEAQTCGKVMASLGWDKVRAGSSTRTYVWRKPKTATTAATREHQSGSEAEHVPF